jgi:membrane-associated phospholipid phosphatase
LAVGRIQASWRDWQLKTLVQYFSNRKHFFSLLLLLPTLVWFKLLEAHLVPEHLIEVPLDTELPFIPAFVIPYLLWFPYIAFGCVFAGNSSKEELYKLVIFLGGGMSVAYIIFMLFPNAVDLRPDVMPTDFLSQLMKIVYKRDTPTNVCPSLHVINGFAVHAALSHTEAFKKRKYLTAISAVFYVFVCLSTVFVKQHSVLDVFGGLAVGLFFYAMLYSNVRPFSLWQQRMHERFES